MEGEAPRIRFVLERDAARISEIYNHYIEETDATFDTEPISAAEMVTRLERADPWLVCETDSGVIGYAYARGWRDRAAYFASVETSIYLAPESTGRGCGRRLYECLLEELRGRGIHVAIGCISLPNEASVALHEALGFEPVGRLREIGRKFDRWVDVGYWQKTF